MSIGDFREHKRDLLLLLLLLRKNNFKSVYGRLLRRHETRPWRDPGRYCSDVLS